MSILWLWFTANILIDLLNLFGTLSGINTGLLGLTVLAWGNSIGDMMANLAISRKGFAEMAMTGCFAGPLFNLLVGMGVSALTQTVSSDSEPIVFSLADKDTRLPFILLLGIVISMTWSLIATVYNKFVITRF